MDVRDEPNTFCKLGGAAFDRWFRAAPVETTGMKGVCDGSRPSLSRLLANSAFNVVIVEGFGGEFQGRRIKRGDAKGK